MRDVREDVKEIQDTLKKADAELWKARALKNTLRSYISSESRKPSFSSGMATDVLDILEERLEIAYSKMIEVEKTLDKLVSEMEAENADT